MLLDRAGNSLRQALKIKPTQTPHIYKEWLGDTDRLDYYRFKLNNRSSFNLTLNGIKANLDVALLNQRGKVLQKSARKGNLPERINSDLSSGVYYIRVARSSGNTRYKLKLFTGISSDELGETDYPPAFSSNSPINSNNNQVISDPNQPIIWDEPITEQDIQNTLVFNTQVDGRFRNLLNSGIVPQQALTEIQSFLAASPSQVQPNSVHATSEGLIWLSHSSGIEVTLDIDMYIPDGQRSGGSASNSTTSNSTNTGGSSSLIPEIKKVGNRRAIVISPFAWDFDGIIFDGDESDEIADSLQEAGFEVTRKFNPHKEDNNVTVQDFMHLDQYGVVVIVSHGGYDPSIVIGAGTKQETVIPGGSRIYTGQVATSQQLIDLGLTTKKGLNDKVTLDPTNGIAIKPEFITEFIKKQMPSSFVYLGSCLSTKIDQGDPSSLSFAKVFKDKGAAAIVGYSDEVDTTVGANKGKAMFKALLDGKLTGQIPSINTTVENDSTPARFELFGDYYLTLLPPFSFRIKNFAVIENGDPVLPVTIKREVSKGTSSVFVTMKDGTATASQDYDSTPIKVVFADGETEKTVNIPIIDDNVVENYTYGLYGGPDEQQFLNLELNYSVGTPALDTAKLYIGENDNPPLPVGTGEGSLKLTGVTPLNIKTLKTRSISEEPNSSNSVTVSFDYTKKINNSVPFEYDYAWIFADGAGVSNSQGSFSIFSGSGSDSRYIARDSIGFVSSIWLYMVDRYQSQVLAAVEVPGIYFFTDELP